MRFFTVMFIMFACSVIQAQVIQFNNEDAYVSYEHKAEKVQGTVRGIKVDIKLNVKDVSKSQIVGRADATTLKTGIKLRDGHLQKEGYFNTIEFPFMTFSSTKFEKKSAGEYRIIGVLKIKGIEKEVVWIFKEDTFVWKGTTSIYTNDFEIHEKKDRKKSKVDVTIVLPLK